MDVLGRGWGEAEKRVGNRVGRGGWCGVRVCVGQSVEKGVRVWEDGSQNWGRGWHLVGGWDGYWEGELKVSALYLSIYIDVLNAVVIFSLSTHHKILQLPPVCSLCFQAKTYSHI